MVFVLVKDECENEEWRSYLMTHVNNVHQYLFTHSSLCNFPSFASVAFQMTTEPANQISRSNLKEFLSNLHIGYSVSLITPRQ